MPDAPNGRPPYSANARRELAARDIERKHGRVLDEIARIAFGATDPALKLRALQALAPYLYPQLKAIEVSGPDGEKLTIEVHKVSSPVSSTPVALPSK